MDVDAASDCVSPFSDAGSGYFSDAMISLRDEPDDDEDDDTDEGRLIYRISRVGRQTRNASSKMSLFVRTKSPILSKISSKFLIFVEL